jgi:tetratricopeptide (TPR) repeat protein
MSRLEQIQQFLIDNPKDPFLHYALAQEYIKMDDSKSALEKYLYLVEFHPKYVATYYHLGKLYYQMGQKELAIDYFDRGIIVAKELGEQHSLSELQSAKLEIEYED